MELKAKSPILVLRPGPTVSEPREPQPSPAQLFSSFELVALAGCLALLFTAILAFGAVEIWSMMVLQVSTAALFIAWALVQVMRGRLVLRVSPLFAPAVLFGLVACFQIAAGLSAYPYQTQVSFLLYLSYGALLFLAVQFFVSKRNYQTVAWSLVTFGLLLALFAIVQDFTSEGLLYWTRKPSQGGSIYGPYVNRNHYAGMMEMLFVFPLAISMSELVSIGKRWMLAFGGALMAASIVFSHSRGGMTVMLLQVLLLSAFMMRGRQSRRATRMILILAPVAFLAWWLGTSAILNRWAEASTADRWPIWRDAFSMILDRPLLGSGLGTFSTVFPRFRSVYSGLFVNAAHNDYLQVLAESGVVGGLALLWFIAALYRRSVPQLRLWHQDWIACTRLAALAGCTGILLHGFVDFNLQIPANAAMFVFLAGMAACSPADSELPLQPAEHPDGRTSKADRRSRNERGVLKNIADAANPPTLYGHE